MAKKGYWIARLSIHDQAAYDAYRDRNGAVVTREVRQTQFSGAMIGKGEHRHFMLKEIYEQPETISHTLSHYVDMGAEKVALRNVRQKLDDLLHEDRQQKLALKAVARVLLAAFGSGC